jgi:methylated-DNA-protein-cysteine methyltransferase related protein
VTPFEDAVHDVMRRLPPGDTYSYAWVASEAGYPGRARAVGALLAQGDGDVPWWRVTRADGRFAEHLATDQAARLRREGVESVNGRVVGRTNHVPRGRARRIS